MLSLGLLVGAWVLWQLPFLGVKRPGVAVRVDKRARLGFLLQAVAFGVVFAGPFWERETAWPREAAAVLFFAAGIGLSFGAVPALGRQWRMDAGLNADHALVRSGAYRLVRHPIYASMLWMLLGSGCLVTSWMRLAVALAFFLAGIEIRVRVEDGLLESRFGDEFREYRRQVPAYFPFLR